LANEEEKRAAAQKFANSEFSEDYFFKLMNQETFGAYRVGNTFENAYLDFIGDLDLEIDVFKDFRNLLAELKVQEYEKEQ
jgi:hypothetical protein